MQVLLSYLHKEQMVSPIDHAAQALDAIDIDVVVDFELTEKEQFGSAVSRQQRCPHCNCKQRSSQHHACSQPPGLTMSISH